MKLHIIVLFFFLFSIEACATKTTNWNTDGTVIIGDKKIKLDMQNAYSDFEYNNGIYLIGFKIDKNGVNQPTLAWLADNIEAPVYWTFTSVLQELFLLDGKIHLLDMNGNIYSLSANRWKKISLKLEPKSRIIDISNGLLSCYPSSLFKASSNIGACYMANRKWKIEVNWRETVPKVCGDYLFVVEEKNRKKFISKYLKSTGKFIAAKEIAAIPEDLCSIRI